MQDMLAIPLLLSTIPAPKEFRDAIESLSPEQQAFCKAYRKMQLAGSLFAVAVVQIKPQLERLLKLDSGALTKEVQLCQDLMSLFIEYQIPSDLLACVRRRCCLCCVLLLLLPFAVKQQKRRQQQQQQQK
jgi:hypothetical protein